MADEKNRTIIVTETITRTVELREGMPEMSAELVQVAQPLPPELPPSPPRGPRGPVRVRSSLIDARRRPRYR